MGKITKQFFTVFVICIIGYCGAAEIAPGFEIGSAGNFCIGGKSTGVTFGLNHAAPGWKNGSAQTIENCQPSWLGLHQYRAEWQIHDGKFNLEFVATPGDSTELTWHLNSANPVPTAYLCAFVKLPPSFEGRECVINGSHLTFPAPSEKTLELKRFAARKDGVNKIEIIVGTFRYEFTTPGAGMLIVSPQRMNGSFYYGLRFAAEPIKGELTSAKINVAVKRVRIAKSAITWSDEILPGVKIGQAGRLLIGGDTSGVTLGLNHSAPGWKNGSMQVQKNCRIERRNSDGYKAAWSVYGGTFDLNFVAAMENQKQLTWELKTADAIPTECLCALATLPENYQGTVVFVNDSAVKLPAPTAKTQNLISVPRCKNGKNKISFQVNGINYSFAGSAGAMIYVSPKQARGWHYGIRFFGTSVKGDIANSTIKIKVTATPIVTEAIDLGSAASTAFSDQLDGDRQGGWTDQGKERDLRSLKPGRRRIGGVNFNILDDRSTKGRSCIVLRGAPRPYFPESAVITSVTGKKFPKLYILHATAWSDPGPAGYIEVTYEDGTHSSIVVKGDRDVADWANGGTRLGNGVRVWKGFAPGFGQVGLYLSSFDLEDKALENITFRSSGAQQVWMIAAVSGGSKESVFAVAPAEKHDVGFKKVYQEDNQWKAINFDRKPVISGSALDFSRFLDAPAGKYGEVIIRDGKFSFKNAPEKLIRFYGTNLTHGCMYPEKSYAPCYAARLASEGINVVRIHLYENGLGNPGIAVKEGATEFNPVEKDKLDFFLSELRKRGIYYILTIYSGAWFPAGTFTDTPGFANRRIRFQVKPLAMISDQARDYMRKWGKNLLLSVNPYTGLAPKDDPALISVELTNENPLNAIDREYPEFTPLFTEACRRYLARRDGREPSEQEVNRFYMIYLLTVLQCDFYSVI